MGDTPPIVTIPSPNFSHWSLLLLILVLGAVVALSIIAFLVIRTRIIDRKMRKRACSRFIVPTTLPTMGTLSLERAPSIEEPFPEHVSVETEDDYQGDSCL